MAIELTAEAAMALLLQGTAPAGMVVPDYLSFENTTVESITIPDGCQFLYLSVNGSPVKIHWGKDILCYTLHIYKCPKVTALPASLRVHELSVMSCAHLTTLPAKLQVRDTLVIINCPAIETLPDDLHLINLTLAGSGRRVRNSSNGPMLNLHQLPPGLRISGQCRINDCPSLTDLPPSLDIRLASSIDLAGCSGLRTLPHGIQAQYVNLSDCTSLTSWDDPEVTHLRQLDISGCRALCQLPPNLHEIDQLDASGCTALTALPPHLLVHEWLDIGATKIQALPMAATPVALRWNGVAISGRVAFHPDAITAEMVLAERNAEVRRIMLERMGTERFFTALKPEIVDKDRDRGGERRLLRVGMPEGEEELRALQVRDPSTGNSYLLRVPPTMQTCHQSAAWIAGFDNPDDYLPVAET